MRRVGEAIQRWFNRKLSAIEVNLHYTPLGRLFERREEER